MSATEPTREVTLEISNFADAVISAHGNFQRHTSVCGVAPGAFRGRLVHFFGIAKRRKAIRRSSAGGRPGGRRPTNLAEETPFDFYKQRADIAIGGLTQKPSSWALHYAW